MRMYDLTPEKKHMMCFVGKGGHGKSIGASYWPTPMKYISMDSRAHAVYNWWMDRDPQRLKNIDIDTYTLNDFDKLATLMENLQNKNPFKGGTIVLDPLTMLGDMLIAYSQSVRGSSGSDKGRVKIPVPDDYKTETNGLKRVMDAGRVLNSHFILCAHILENIYYPLGEEVPRITRTLLTAGKQPAAVLPGMFDELWLFTVQSSGVQGKPPDYKIVTRPYSEFDTLRTSCNMPVELIWTNKNLYELASPFLNKVRKKEEPNAQTVPPTGAVQAPPTVVPGTQGQPGGTTPQR